jgi:hypothetical protein
MVDRIRRLRAFITKGGWQGMSDTKSKPNWTALMKPGEVKSWLALELWLFCERFGLSLGRFAPTVFGWMVGAKGKRVK